LFATLKRLHPRKEIPALPHRTCVIILSMGFFHKSAPIAAEEDLGPEESGLLKTIGWISAALGAVALGLIVGREIRQRYKFNRRTPYDLYAHSGDELPDVECGVGI
jgi:hypothetical protein